MISETHTAEADPALLAGDELKTLARHSSHYLAGLLASFAVGLISFPIFTRALSIAEYGLMDLAQKVVLMLSIGGKGGLQNAVLRFFDKDRFDADPPSGRTYYSTMYFGVLVIAVGVALASLAVMGLGSGKLLGSSLTKLIYFISALVVLRAVAAVVWGFLRIEERTKALNYAMVGTRAGTLVLVCLMLLWEAPTARTYFTSAVVVEAAMVAILTASLSRRRLLAPSQVDTALLRAGIAFGMPLAVYEFAFAVLGSADRFLVQYFLGPDSLGVYSVAYGLSQHASDLVLTPLSLAIQPIYMRLWTSGSAQKTADFLSTTLDLFLMGAAGMLAVVAAVANPLVILLASSKYAGADRLIPILLAGLLVYATYIFVAAGLLIWKRTLQMAGILVLAAVLNVGLNCLLLPVMGLNGSALATLVSYAVCIVLLRRASNRLLPLEWRLGALARYLAVGAVAWFAGSRLELGAPVFDLVGRAALTATLYGAGLYFLDRRARGWARLAVAKCRRLS